MVSVRDCDRLATWLDVRETVMIFIIVEMYVIHAVNLDDVDVVGLVRLARMILERCCR